MKRLVALLATLMVIGGFALVSAGWAQEELPEEHPHVLVLGLEFDGEGNPIGFRKCIELAAGKALRPNAHHAHMHMGTAGEALFFKAGHGVAPYPNCAVLIAD